MYKCGPHPLRKNLGFVSGDRFSDTVGTSRLNAPLGVGTNLCGSGALLRWDGAKPRHHTIWEFRHRCLALAVFVEPRQFPAKESVVGKVLLQAHQKLARPRHIFLTDVRDGQGVSRWPCAAVFWSSAMPPALSPVTPPRRTNQRTGAAIDPMM